MSRPLTVAAGSTAPTGQPSRAQPGRTLPVLLLAGALACLLALGLRLIDVGAGDLSIVGMFSTDEQLAGQLVRAMLEHGDFGLSHFYSYGPLDLYAARLMLWPWSLLHPVSDEAIIVTLRGISLLSGLGCVAVTFVLGRHLWSAAAGALAGLAIALSPVLVSWSTTAHPDTLQLFWLLLGLRCALELPAQRSRPVLVLGAICAALAFATKYEGELLLPVLWLGDLLGQLNGQQSDAHGRIGAALLTSALDAALSALIFAACFLLVDPSVILEPRQFVYQARLEAGLAHTGHLFLGSAGGPAWPGTLAGTGVLGPLLAALALAGLLLWCVRDLRGVFRPRAASPGAAALRVASEARLLLALWTAGYLLFLIIWIGDRQPRYLLPALPGLALFAAAGLTWLARRSRTAAILAGLLAVAALVTPAWSTLQYERVMAGRMANPQVRARIDAGRWLATHATSATPIVADAYAYLPPSFSAVDVTFGLTRAEIAAKNPQVIVTDSAIRDRFRDPSAATRYVDGPDAYHQIAATYDAIEAGQFACFPLLQRFGPESIYGRLPGELRPAGC